MRSCSMLVAVGGALIGLTAVAACSDGGDGYRSGRRSTYIDTSGTVNRNDNCYDRRGEWNGRCDREDADDDRGRDRDRGRRWLDRIFR